MTICRKQYMYNEQSRAVLAMSGWANFVVSIYQDCNIDNMLNARSEL